MVEAVRRRWDRRDGVACHRSLPIAPRSRASLSASTTSHSEFTIDAHVAASIASSESESIKPHIIEGLRAKLAEFKEPLDED